MFSIPQISHPTDRPNYTEVTLYGPNGTITLAYSYRTCVGFRTGRTGCVVRENDWGPTTGKHLRYFAEHVDHKDRLSADAFGAALSAAMLATFGAADMVGV